MSFPDIVFVIENGKIVEGPDWNSEHGNWVVRIAGETVDGEPTSIVLGVDLDDEQLYLVTVY